MMYRLVCAVVRALLGFYFFRLKGLKCEGVENIPAEGAVIVAPNHKSNFDPPAIGVCSPRIVHYMAKEELFSGIPYSPRRSGISGHSRSSGARWTGPRCGRRSGS